MRGDTEWEGMSEMRIEGKGGGPLLACFFSPDGELGHSSKNHLRGEVENVGESLVARRSQSRKEGSSQHKCIAVPRSFFQRCRSDVTCISTSMQTILNGALTLSLCIYSVILFLTLYFFYFALRSLRSEPFGFPSHPNFLPHSSLTCDLNKYFFPNVN